MIDRTHDVAQLERRLSEAEATVRALLSGEVDAVLDARTDTPVLLFLAQKALLESEERYRSIVETANEGIAMMNFDGTMTYVNQRFADMVGFPASEVTGRRVHDFLPPSYHDRATLRLQRAMLGEPEESEAALLQPNGEEMWVFVKSSCIRNAAGTCVGLLAMMTDWTRHREAERALRESEAEYRQIIESTTDGIVKVSLAGTITFVNTRLAEMLGYTPSELIGTDLLTVVTPSEHEAVIQSLKARADGVTNLHDTCYRHKAGFDIAVSIAGSALRDETGTVIGALGIVRDVTERNKMQAQLIVSDRMASVGTLAAGVAHEINNPLAAVIANLEYMSEGLVKMQEEPANKLDFDWTRTRLAEPLVDAREAADRVMFIVRDLMIFSRSPSDEEKVAVDVNAVLESSLRMGWNEIRHRANLVKQLANVPAIKGHQARLGQVFLNLIVNAAQSLPVGQLGQHEIRVETQHANNTVFVDISDTGSGIAPEAIDRIFDAFYTTKAVGVGTGLGLAICQRIVSDMGGTLTVRSTLGSGSTFRVALPVADELFVTDLPVTQARVQSTGGRLLVVDDEDVVSRSVQRSVGDSYDVSASPTAWAALALLNSGEQFDVILCDLMMPDMTGMDLYHALMKQNPAQAARMVFMTGGAFTVEARQFLANGGVTFIEKPFNLEQLRRVLNEFLSTFEPVF